MTDVIQNAVKWDHPAAAHATIIDADKGIIDWKGRTKFGLVGFASSSRDLAPWDDPSWILMGLNQLYRHCPRFDAWIDIHHYFRDPRSMVDGTDEIEWMKSAPIPIFQHERQPDIPNSVRYPIEDVSGQNPAYPWGVDYFTSTISYMIALAIRDGFKTIGVWGVDLIVGQEYFYQKACAEMWLGIANGQGIEIHLPAQTALLKHGFRYGYQTEPDCGPIKMSMFEAREKEIRGRLEAVTREAHTLDGALQDLSYWKELYTLRMRGGTIGEGT